MRRTWSPQGLGCSTGNSLKHKNQMPKRHNPNCPMTTTAIDELRALIAAVGDEAEAARAVGISLPTLGRALAGMKVARSVRFMVEAKLREYAARAA